MDKSSEIILDFLLNFYFYFAFAFSLMYGLFAIKMFMNESTRKKLKEDHGVWGQIREFWFNFTGAAAGWISFYLFLEAKKQVGIEDLSFTHFIFFIVGVIGIAGFLPATLMGIIQSLAYLVKRIIEKSVG